MDNNSDQTFIKVDNNKMINEKCIIWVSKMNECLEICTKTTGCSRNLTMKDTHTLCKLNNPESYDKLNKSFE